MDKIEKIRQEIERRRGYISVTHFVEELLSLLDTLSEKSDKSLDEAAYEYAVDSTGFIDTTAYNVFIDGAEWQKAQMMKEAVEGDVNTYEDLAAGKSWAEFVVKMPTNKLGDKVRIIIVKEG